MHEAWLKLGSVDAAQRGAFLSMAARTMRNVLIDHLRGRRAIKRGGGVRAFTLDTDIAFIDGRDNGLRLLAIEQGLEKLEQLDPRLASVVECHFLPAWTSPRSVGYCKFPSASNIATGDARVPF